MGAIARVKWQAKSDSSTITKYVAELSFLLLNDAISGNITETNEKFIYSVKIDAYETGSASPVPFRLYEEKYKSLPEALAFFKSLSGATHAVPYEGHNQHFLCTGLYDN